jgi:multicomponent Na+:H+ antiporter subunit F
MHEAVFYFAVVWMTILLVVSVFAVISFRSPASRILALDTLSTLMVALLVLFSAWQRSHYYLDVALALALLSFNATLVMSRYRAENRVF